MSQDSEERQLVLAAQQDPSRFADLYEQNFYRVYAYIARRAGDRHAVPHSAELACHEVSLRAPDASPRSQ